MFSQKASKKEQCTVFMAVAVYCKGCHLVIDEGVRADSVCLQIVTKLGQRALAVDRIFLSFSKIGFITDNQYSMNVVEQIPVTTSGNVLKFQKQ